MIRGALRGEIEKTEELLLKGITRRNRRSS